MSTTFIHGVRITEISDGTRSIETASSSVIGIVGTAPYADSTEFPLNTPVLIAGSRLEAANLYNPDLFTEQAAALQAIADDPATDPGEAATAQTDADALTALVAVASSNKGTLPKAVDMILDQAGAAIVVIRVEQDTDDASAGTQANIIGGVNPTTDSYEGLQAFVGSKSIIGEEPKVLLAPGFTHEKAVVDELITVAEEVRAVVIADCPGATDAEAKTYRDLFGSRRLILMSPTVEVLDGEEVVTKPASPLQAGIIAKLDAEKGFWWSPSNQVVLGVNGTTRPIDFKMGSATSRANLLNASEITTIIQEKGFRVWGNRTCSDDPKWKFISVVRTADILHDSLQQAHLWAVDKNITTGYIKSVTDSVNAYIRSLISVGALAGGECWADPDKNTPADIANGSVTFSFDFSATTPAEQVTFESTLTDEYYTSIFE